MLNGPALLWRMAKATGMQAFGRTVAPYWPYPVRASLNNGREMFVDLRSSIGRELFATGAFDFEAIRPGLDRLTAGGVFIDIGANIGAYAMLALDKLGPTGQVHCFEIDPRPLTVLKKTITTFKLANVHVHRCALADRDGPVGFVPGADHGHNRIDLDGIVDPKLPCMKLDTWILNWPLPRVDVIKIDVEGAERFVLEGARATIAKYKPLILCEAADKNTLAFGYKADDLISAFTDMGYVVKWLNDVWTPTLIASVPE